MEEILSQPDKSKTGNANAGNKHQHLDKDKMLAEYIPPEMDDPQLDKVIDDIIVSESNEVLAAEDSMISADNEKKPKKKSKLSKILKSKWLYISLGLVVVVIFVLPYTRYPILGKFIKNSYQLTLIDSVTKNPISGATIKIGKQTFTSNAYGLADIKLPLGKHQYRLSKQYYAENSGYIFVGLSKKEASTVLLKATGRQVAIKIVNKLSGRPLAGVKISILNTDATTNSLGQTQIVLPTKQSSYEATITANSFNTLTVPVQVTTSKTANVISLVPSGNIFYLNNATGTINVIKANLDGSNPTIELAGTGLETSSTELMPSPDWKYLVLEARRTGSQAELYVINTATGDINEFDSSADNFTLIGWSGDDFIYDEIASQQPTSSVGREVIRSYNAINGQLNIIDEDQVLGSSPSYAYQNFANFQLLPNLLIYTTYWNSVGSYDLSNSSDTIRGIEPNGLNKKDYTTFAASTTGTMSIVRNQPNNLYLAVTDSSTNQASYYNFANGAVSSANINSATFSQAYPTYYLSPSGSETIWQTNVDNKPVIYIGNQNGQNSKRLLFPSGYNLYGWYDNVYVLLSKGGDLYIAPATGTNSPTLIGSYFSPN